MTGAARLLAGGDRVLAELLEKLLKFEGNLAGTGTGGLVAVLYLEGGVLSEALKTGSNLFYEIFHCVMMVKEFIVDYYSSRKMLFSHHVEMLDELLQISYNILKYANL